MARDFHLFVRGHEGLYDARTELTGYVIPPYHPDSRVTIDGLTVWPANGEFDDDETLRILEETDLFASAENHTVEPDRARFWRD